MRSPAVYKEAERARILAAARRAPDRDADGTATWSLSTLRRALRRAPDGLPGVSEYTIWCVLRGAGWQGQRSRSWCETGVVVRKRKAGPVVVTDPNPLDRGHHVCADLGGLAVCGRAPRRLLPPGCRLGDG